MQARSQKQMKYILKNFPDIPASKGETQNEEDLDKILKNHYSGREMAKASSILKSLLESKPWVKNMKKLKVSSVESSIHILSVSAKTNVIVKVPKKPVYKENNIRSFYNGWEINKLRYLVPNFLYTFFLSEETHLFQEHIPGETLEKAINSLKFPEFLRIFSQILLALEVAQRQCSLCHYDLHIGNVVLRPIDKPYSYTVVLDGKRYDITAERWIPVIIDYGLSSTEIKGKTIGTYMYSDHGIFNYPIQGVDVYKFLFYSYARSKGDLQREIASLFLFYGTHDPYKILITDTSKLPEISSQYLKKTSETYVATNTPEEFLLWILENQEYPKVMELRERDIYHPVNSIPDSGKEIPKIPSYIMLTYIEKLTGTLERDKEKYIEKDRKVLETYKDVPLPEELTVRDHANRILGTQIGNAKEVEKLLPIFIAETEFISQLEPYFQYLYTIRELHIEDEYEKFMEEFLKSPHYILYTKLCFIVIKAKRWSHTLFLSM